MKQDDTFSEMLEVARQLDAEIDPALKRCRMASGVLAVLSLATIATIASMVLIHVLGIDITVHEYDSGRIVYIGIISISAILIFLKHIFVWTGRRSSA